MNYAKIMQKHRQSLMGMGFLLIIIAIISLFLIYNPLLKISQILGFQLNQVIIEGKNQIPADELQKALQLQPGDPILFLNIQDLKNRLEQLGWIKNASIERVFPNKLIIKLNERTPDALYEQNNGLFLMDGEGVLLAPYNPEFHENYRQKLRIVSGVNAQLHYKRIYELIDQEALVGQKW